MILIAQNRKQIINFDNVNHIALEGSGHDITAYFVDGTPLTIAYYENTDKAQTVFTELVKGYKGNGVVTVPLDR